MQLPNLESEMIARRVVSSSVLLATAIGFFTLGAIHSRRTDAASRAAYDAKLEAIRADLAGVHKGDAVVPAATSGTVARAPEPSLTPVARARMVAEIKEQLQNEMGLLPVHLLRDRRSSFVELYSSDNFGKTNYGTAGYLGHGYFVTVKHAVVALRDEDERQNSRKIASVRIVYNGKEIPAKIIDTGDAEVHTGDWAIIKTRELDLPPLRIDTSFAYDFAEPLFRLGNDYSKGIIVSTGYAGQRTANGLITCLTDGHPGVSGGGVLNQRGDLVGIPIGRMQGDYRFSFILPMRAEMLRKLPALEPPAAAPATALETQQ